MRIVEKAGRLIEKLACRSDWGVSELAREMGADKSLVHRVLRELVRLEWVQQDVPSKRYSLGPAFPRKEKAGESLFELVDLADPIITALAVELDETIYLSGRYLDHNVIVLIREGTNEVRAVSRVGRRSLMHCGAAGKVLLAYSELPSLGSFLGRPLERYTPNTIVTVDRLREELQAVRERGWSYENEEFALGVSGLAAPVLRRDNSLEAAISIRAPSGRLTMAHAVSIAPRVIAAAGELSSALAVSRSSSRSEV